MRQDGAIKISYSDLSSTLGKIVTSCIVHLSKKHKNVSFSKKKKKITKEKNKKPLDFNF